MKNNLFNNPYFIRTFKSIIKSLYITTGVFLFLFSFFHIIGAVYISHITEDSSSRFQAGIKSDLKYLKDNGDKIAQDQDLIKYILAEDMENISSFLQIERTKHSIGLIGVTDKNGVILSRTRTSNKIGDNAFINNPLGRHLIQNGAIESVEAPVGFDPHQVFLTTGRFVIDKDKMVGSLFANYLTDDTYAKNFRDKYLPDGVEVVFYNKNAGVYGNSFLNLETNKLIESYFNSGSDWIKNGMSDKTISFGDDSFYFVKNIIFPGLESSPGGALLFIKRQDISNTGNLVTTFITFLVFILLIYWHHKHSYGEEKGWRYLIIVLLIAIPAILASFFILRFQNIGYLKLEHVPYTLYNSTIRFQPDSGVYVADSEQLISIIVDTGDEAINAIKTKVIFNPEDIIIKSIDTTDSGCSYFIEKKIDPKIGQVDISCIVVKESGRTGSIMVGNIVVAPKKVGNFELNFDKEETQVLANDGLGTNVLRAAQSSSYIVEDFSNSKNVENKNSIIIFSPTHPNQSRWYNSDKAEFVWLGDKDSTYFYSIDSMPEKTPTNIDKTIQGNKVSIPIFNDGVFYFHLVSTSGGITNNYKIKVDRTAPLIKSMLLSSTEIRVGDVVRFLFESEDMMSGVEGNYYVDLGNHLFLPIGLNLFVPFLESGDQNITLRIYDNAGNYSERTDVVKVRP